jgi:hypothetical protein
MAPYPVPAPKPHAIVTHAKKTWEAISNILGWFTKIVTTSYAYSDGLIKSRQGLANNKAKIAKAEEEATKIMADQKAERDGAKEKMDLLVRRDHLGSLGEKELVARSHFDKVDFDDEGFLKWLEVFEDE